MIIAKSPNGTPGCDIERGACSATDNVAPSIAAPGGFSQEQTPQFVGIGWDDNGDAEGVRWALSLHRRIGGHSSFFVNSVYGSSDSVREAWLEALANGHELGNHTAGHLSSRDGHPFTVAEWQDEIRACTEFLITAGVMQASALSGFRAPYLDYDDQALTAVERLGFHYDCSIEEGHQEDQDGSNYCWPYTLDQRSPGHTARVQRAQSQSPISELTPHAGLWELPVYALIAPPDEQCAEYGVPAGFRQLLAERQQFFDAANGKITGFDYNLWAPIAHEGFAMTKAEFLATTKYSFDQHYSGNRAPFLMGAHSDYYVDAWNQNAPGTPLAADRRAAVEELAIYASGKAGVQFVSHQELLGWLRSPKAL